MNTLFPIHWLFFRNPSLAAACLCAAMAGVAAAGEAAPSGHAVANAEEAPAGQPPEAPAAKKVFLAGVLSKPEATAYQYGTHALTGRLITGDPAKAPAATLFALKSGKVKLDAFVGKKVIVTAVKIDGYPLEGGPDFYEVTAVEIDGEVKAS